MNRPRDKFGNHDGQQHLRYAEVYSISAATTDITGATNASPISVTSASHGFTTGDEVTIAGVTGNTAANGTWTVTVTGTNTFTLNDSTGDGAYSAGGTVGYAQPVKVKLLKWDDADSRYEVYGSEFAVGDRETADEVAVEDKIWITRRRDAQRWEVFSTIGNHYQVIRGTCYAAVLDTDQAFQLENLVALEQHASLPTSPVWVANIPAVAHSMGDTVYALYRSGIAVTHTGAPATVDWEALGGSTSSAPPLRAFELTANKTLASATATAKWLDLDGNLVGSDVTLHDPEHRFSGRIEDDLFSGSAGHRGYAIQRTDLAAEDPDQWDIVELDGLLEFVVGEFVKTTNYPSVGSTTTLEYVEEVDQHGYDRHPPAVATDELTYTEDADVFDLDHYLVDPPNASESTPTTLRVLLKLTDPDTSPPSYRVIEHSGSAATAILVRTTEVITARSSTTAGSGAVQPVTISGATLSDSGNPETAYNLATITYASGYYLTAIRVNGQLILNTWDSKSAAGWTAGNNQSYGHDASDEPEWQDDDTECP